MTTELRAYDEIVDLIAAGPSSERVASFQPSEPTRQREFDLLAREKSTGVSPEEALELDHYLQIEHLMRLARAWLASVSRHQRDLHSGRVAATCRGQGPEDLSMTWKKL